MEHSYYKDLYIYIITNQHLPLLNDRSTLKLHLITFFIPKYECVINQQVISLEIHGLDHGVILSDLKNVCVEQIVCTEGSNLKKVKQWTGATWVLAFYSKDRHLYWQLKRLEYIFNDQLWIRNISFVLPEMLRNFFPLTKINLSPYHSVEVTKQI